MHAKSITLMLLCLAAGAGCRSSGTGAVVTLPDSMVKKEAPVVKSDEKAAVAPAAKPAAKDAVAPAAKPAAAKNQAGCPVKDVVAAAKGLRMEFFTLDDKALDGLPSKAAGSVSIHSADGSGQDNYRFDETGTITRHLRSYGENYGAGVWEPVP